MRSDDDWLDRLRKDHRRNEDGDCRVCVWEPWPCDTARAVAEIDGLHINVQAAVWLMAEKDDRIAELEAKLHAISREVNNPWVEGEATVSAVLMILDGGTDE